MPKDMSAVGASATSSKRASGLDGDEVYAGRGSFETADNGGAIVRASMTKKKTTGRDQMCSLYCDDKVFVFADTGKAAAKVQQLLGLKEGDKVPE